MPELVRTRDAAAPITHFVMLTQGIPLPRRTYLRWVWDAQFLALLLIGSVFFGVPMQRFRSFDYGDGLVGKVVSPLPKSGV